MFSAHIQVHIECHKFLPPALFCPRLLLLIPSRVRVCTALEVYFLLLGLFFFLFFFFLIENKYLWGHGQYRCLGSVCISFVSVSSMWGQGRRSSQAPAGCVWGGPSMARATAFVGFEPPQAFWPHAGPPEHELLSASLCRVIERRLGLVGTAPACPITHVGAA